MPATLIVTVPATFQGKTAAWWASRAVKARRDANRRAALIKELRAKLERRLQARSPSAAICQVFGPYCTQALAVATCESHLYTAAQNGQYLGLFQMGDFARSHYGHGADALTQARAAYAYFVDSGRDWSPWECKP